MTNLRKKQQSVHIFRAIPRGFKYYYNIIIINNNEETKTKVVNKVILI